MERIEPFAADVYAAACVAYEVLTGKILIDSDTVKGVLDQHFSSNPGNATLATLARTPRLAPLAELLRTTLIRDHRRRPSISKLRAGFAAVARDLRTLAWPLPVQDATQ
jgi:hypothetical protein